MSMTIKVGNRVNPFNNMNMTGTVVAIVSIKTKHMTASGVPGQSYEFHVRMDTDGDVLRFLPGQLMRID
jgi:hypothetical protein